MGAPGRMSWREVCVTGGLLLLVALSVYGPYAASAGFTIDDWGHAAEVAHPANGLLRDYWLTTSNRPVLVLYVPATFLLWGAHPFVHHFWSIALATAMAVALYAVLRKVSVERWAAGAIALLVLLFPWSDSIRLWATAGHINFAITLALCGVLLALHGLDMRAAGRIDRSRILHACAVVLYAVSVLTYEIAGVSLLMAGALYLTYAPFRAIRWRWLIDVIVIVAALAWTALRAARALPSLAEMLTRAQTLANEAVIVFAKSAEPLGKLNHNVVLVILLAIVAGAVAMSVTPNLQSGVRRALRRWLVIMGSGVLVALASWVLYIPAAPYYRLDSLGVDNRTNAMASVGIVSAVYAVIVLAALLIFHRRAGWRPWVAAASVALALPLSASYIIQLRRDADTWNNASTRAKELLGYVHIALPNIPSESTIYTFNYPGSETQGVVIFAYSWDLNGAVKLLYDDPTLRGYPVIEGTQMECQSDGVVARFAGGESADAPYGDTFFIDVPEGRAVRIASMNVCNKVLSTFTPGPEVRYSSSLPG